MKSWAQDVYWGVRIFLSTGTTYWYAEHTNFGMNAHDLSTDMKKAKVFLTKGSAERFIAKLKAASTQLADIKMEAHELREQQ